MTDGLRTASLRRRKELLGDLRADPKGPLIRPWLWIALPVAMLLGATVVIRLLELDYAIQEALFRAGGDSWSIGDHPFWQALYRFGTVLPAFIVLASFVGLVGGARLEEWRRWRKVFLFSILLAVTGPGVITNGLLKEYWGRPRPRHVEGLGGHERHEPVLTIDRESKGKSFPCGHATMGYYFLGGFLLLRRHRRRLAEGFLLFGMIYGTLIGLARMAQGGHFASDVIWAAGVCWFTAMGLYYGLGLHRGPFLAQEQPRRMSPSVRVLAGLAGLGVLGGILLATPYREERDLRLRNDYAQDGPLRIHLTLVAGESELKPGDEFRITGEAFGHGVPTSRIAVNYLEYDFEDLTAVIYQERISGWFAEVDEQLEVDIPWSRTKDLWIQISDASTWLYFPDTSVDSSIEIMDGDGEIHVETRGTPWHWAGERGERDSSLSLRVEEGFEGSLFIDGEKICNPGRLPASPD